MNWMVPPCSSADFRIYYRATFETSQRGELNDLSSPFASAKDFYNTTDCDSAGDWPWAAFSKMFLLTHQAGNIKRSTNSVRVMLG
ncbi:hypothetical protein BDZ97DRAFT_1835370, partial [Flammula alnicola]